MEISSIMVRKVKTVSPGDTVKKAALIMSKYKIGSVIVVVGEKPVGILTESDVLRDVAALDKNASKVKCKDIMSKPVRSIRIDDRVVDAIAVMSKRKIKRLIVTRNDKLVGIVTASDVLKSGEKIEYAALKKLAEFFLVYEGSGQAG